MRNSFPLLARNLAVAAALAGGALAAPSAAAALESCSKDAECASTEVCHGGTCLPKAQQCASSATCKPHQACDFTCPHGSWASAGVTSTDPGGDTPDSGGGEGSSSGGSSGSAGSGSSGSAGSGSSGSSGGSGGSAGGSDSGTGTGGSGVAEQAPPCPKDVGVCVVDAAKVKPSPSCEAMCAVIGKCGGLGGSSSTPPSTGVEPQPAPGADPGSSGGDDAPDGGSSGSGGGSDDGPDGGSSGSGGSADGGSAGGKEGEGGGQPLPAETPEQIAADTSACAVMCTVLELEAIAKAELAAVQQCVAQHAKDSCEAIETACSAQGEAMEKAMDKDEDALELVFTGSFGGGSAEAGGQPVSSEDKSANDPAAGNGGAGGTGASGSGGEAQSTATGANDGAASAGGASAGCSAAGRAAPRGGFALLLLALGLPLWLRRRLATA